jgi:hypothetical protein
MSIPNARLSLPGRASAFYEDIELRQPTSDDFDILSRICADKIAK